MKTILVSFSSIIVIGQTCAAAEALVCSPDTSGSSSPRSAYYRTVDESMMVMHHAMEHAARSGDIDRDFAATMIPHHQGAIDMARAILLHGKDPAMRRLAQEIITEQTVEIRLMERFLASVPSAAPRSAEPVLTATAGLVAKPVSVAVSSRDRVYTADQISNTVSVIDPGTNQLLGVIRLGDPFPAGLSPLYRGALLVHGLGFSPDGSTLAAVSIGSNSVTLIETATNRVKGVVYVGRSPHEAFFTPDGKELWVTIRGEDYVSVIDPVRLRETARIQTANGPGMVLFRPDGELAFVPSSFTPELCVIDVRTKTVVARVRQESPFSPNLAVSQDGREVWFTLKDVGKVQVIRAAPPFETLATLDVGPLTNHVALVDNARGQFAYITVGGLNEVQVWRRGAAPKLIARIKTGDLPHGIWPSGDGTRAYVSLENGDAVQAIDTLENTVIAEVGVGQLPQAIVYVPNAVAQGSGTENLVPLGESGRSFHLRLAAVADKSGAVQGSVVVNSLGQLDHLQMVASGLEPGRDYQLWIEDTMPGGHQRRTPLARARANPAGAIVVQALGPLREVAERADEQPDSDSDRRLLVLSAASDDRAVLRQVN